MSFSDETLMAYADGELDEPERSAVAAAERDDPAVAASIARHRALRTNVFAAFAGVLEEPLPARLQPPAGAATGAQAGKPAKRLATVASLDAARARKAQVRDMLEPHEGEQTAAPRKPWPRWGALAASLAVGVLAGSVWMMGDDPGMVVADANGRLLARGELARALSQQLASETPATAAAASAGGRVRIGVSFAARGGGYCRSFTAGGSAGLACREGDSWRIPVLRDAPRDTGAYRQAASTAPAAVLEVIDERIDGMTLDAAAERAARDRGWKR